MEEGVICAKCSFFKICRGPTSSKISLRLHADRDVPWLRCLPQGKKTNSGADAESRRCFVEEIGSGATLMLSESRWSGRTGCRELTTGYILHKTRVIEDTRDKRSVHRLQF